MATVDFPEQIKELGATLTSIEKVLDLVAMRVEITSLQEHTPPKIASSHLSILNEFGQRLLTLNDIQERLTELCRLLVRDGFDRGCLLGAFRRNAVIEKLRRLHRNGFHHLHRQVADKLQRHIDEIDALTGEAE